MYTWVYNKDGNYKILSLDGSSDRNFSYERYFWKIGSFSHGYSPVKIKGKWGLSTLKAS